MSHRRKTTLHSARAIPQGGFTLLEILIAIALLAGIAGLLISNLDRILGSGNEEITRIFVNETMEGPLMTYRIHTGNYPSTEEGLQALVTQPSEDATGWKGPYTKSIPDDPWGNPYQYRFPGERNVGSYDIWSLGPDGEESADDIGNWESGGDDEDGAQTGEERVEDAIACLQPAGETTSPEVHWSFRNSH